MKKNNIKNIIIFIMISIATIVFWIISPKNIMQIMQKENISLNSFMHMIDDPQSKIKEIYLSPNNVADIHIEHENLSIAVVLPKNNTNIIDKLISKNITIYLQPPSKNINIVYFAIIHVITGIIQLLTQIIYFKYLFGYGNSKDNGEPVKIRTVKFSDIIGMQREKDKLLDAYNYMINFEKYKKMGFTLQNGIILSGPPGNGKTLLARGLAGEVNAHFIGTTAAEFVSLYVGSGALAVRNIYEEARKKGPSIVFIDEADALGTRSNSNKSASQEYNSTINQLLVELDGTNDNSQVLTILATNFVSSIDKALLRSGRIGHYIDVSNPTITERKIFITETLKKLNMIHYLDIENWVDLTAQSSRAYITSLLNDSGMYAIKTSIKNKTSPYDVALLPHHIEETFLENEVGPKTEMIYTERELLNTTYHEVGHAFLYYYFREVLGKSMKFITIECRARVLGFVMYSLDEREMIDLSKLRARICVSLAGTLAEKVFFDRRTPGCYSDIKNSRYLAELYVLGGMNDSYGLHHITSKGTPGGWDSLVSEKEKENIYNEVTKLINELTTVTYNILNENKEIIHKFAGVLRQQLTITKDDIYRLFDDVQRCTDIIPIQFKDVMKIKG